MFSETVEVLWNENVGPGYFKIGVQCNKGYADAIPGQFVMLRLNEQISPLLRRPFSLHRIIEQNGIVQGVEILYRVVGKGTRALSRHQTGKRIDILGPLGKGFDISKDHRRVFIVAGGVGIAPMVFLLSSLKKSGVDLSTCHAFLGGRTSNDLLCIDDCSDFGINLQVTTDDGSTGDMCLVTTPVETSLAENRPDMIYACGPMEMLKCIVGLAEKYDVPCQVSVETVMACGIGTCLGCAVEPKNDREKYLHACVDGPVFDAGILKL
jgi:dihydroorotate dehydrogenase electron transfer subunit